MTMRSGRKKSGGRGSDDPAKRPRKRAARPGLPAESSIVSEKAFTSPGNKRYRIITTSERDAYDEPDPVTEPKKN
jgi:hypothetical protein